MNKLETLKKWANKAKNILTCSNEQARTYARDYANYLESVKVNAPCLCFEDRLKK